MQLAVYGGSFDPPHRAHVLAAKHVLATGQADRVLVVPVFQHAFNKHMEPFEHRLRMCEIAFGGIDDVEVSAIEGELPTPSYTVQTLRALHERYPRAQLRFVVGADALRESHKWRSFDELRQIAPLIVLGRVGIPHPEAPEAVLPDVSSTEVRSWLGQRHLREAREELAREVPAGVLDYIEAHGLYASPSCDEASPSSC